MAKREYVKNLEEVRNVAAEIEDQLVRIELGFGNISSAEKKTLDMIKQWNDEYKESEKYSKKNIDRAKEMSKAQSVILNKQSDITDLEDELVRLKKIEGKVDTKNAQAMVKKAVQQKKINNLMGEMDDLIGGIGGSIMKFMQNPLMLVVVAIKFIIDLFMRYEGILKEVGAQFGAIGQMSKEFRDNAVAIDKEMRGIGKTFSDIVPEAHTLASEMGIANTAALDLAVEMHKTSVELGIGVSHVTDLAIGLRKVAGITSDMLSHVIETTAYFADQAGVAPRAVIEDMAGNMENMAKYTFQGAQQMIRAAIAAKKLGVNLSAVDSIASSILDFETSIQNEMELAAILGKRINFTEARRMAAAGDLSGMMDDISSQMGGQLDLTKMDYFQKEKLRTSLGLTNMQMQSMIRAQQEGVDLSEALAGNMDEASKKADEITPKEARTAMQGIQDALDQMVSGIMEGLIPEFEKFNEMVRGFTGKLTYFIDAKLPVVMKWAKDIAKIFIGLKIAKGAWDFFSMFRKGGALRKAFSKEGWLRKAFSSKGWLGKGLSKMTSGLKSMASKIGGKKGLLGKLWGGIKKVGKGAWQGIKKGGKAAWSGIKKGASYLNPGKLVKGSMGKIAGKLLKGGLVGALMNIGQFGSILTSKDKPEKKARQTIQLGGSILGGMAGAAIGSVVPGIGTWLGSMGGAWLGDWLGGKKWAQDPLVPHVKKLFEGTGKKPASAAVGGITTQQGLVNIHPQEAIIPLEAGGINLSPTAVKTLAAAIGNAHSRAYNGARMSTIITKEDFKQISELPNF